jgi:hypothetical protein
MNLCYMESRTVACSFIVVTRAGNLKVRTSINPILCGGRHIR